MPITPEGQHFFRLIGCRDGLSHALISLHSAKSALLGPNRCYLPPKRHCRKRAHVLNKVAELERVEAMIQRQLDEVRAAFCDLTEPEA